MEILSIIILSSQLIFTFIAGMYFFQNLKFTNNDKNIFQRDFKRKQDNLNKLRSIKLNISLSEKTRPINLTDIVGQENGIKALKSALCTKNPRHVVIYGPPGEGFYSRALSHI